MICCHTQGKAMRTSCVFTYISADSTGFLASGIGSVEKSKMADFFRQMQVDHARLDNSNAIFWIDFYEVG